MLVTFPFFGLKTSVFVTEIPQLWLVPSTHHLGHGPRHQGAVASLRLLNRRAGKVNSHHQLDAALTMLPGVPLARPFGRMGKGETLLFVASAVAKNETWLAEGSCKWCFYWEKIYNAGSRVGFPMPAQI